MSYLGIYCPIGYDQFGSHCFKLIENWLNWYNAEMNCKSENGHLTRIPDNKTRLFINQLLVGYKNFEGTITSMY